MTRSASEILNEALALPEDARAVIAGSLIASLAETFDEAAEAEWAVEIARRIVDLDHENVKLVPWAEVRRRLGPWRRRWPRSTSKLVR